MTTFTGYVLSLRPRLLRPSWEDKFITSCIGIPSLVVLGILFGLPDAILRTSPWFMLLWTGTIPLGLYARYCSKKENGELK